MSTAILNTAPAAIAPQPPLLSAPPNSASLVERDVEDVFSVAEIPDDGAVPRIVSLVRDLQRLSPEWNAPYFDATLFNHIDHFKDTADVEARLSAELIFFKALYEPADRFSIYPVDEYVFDCDGASFSTILFESASRVYGCTDFTSFPKALVIDYIQGLNSSTSAEQREAIGDTWFDALMVRVINAHAPLRDLGIELMLRIAFNDYQLPRMVRDRYFVGQPSTPGLFHELNPNRARVKRAMGAT